MPGYGADPRVTAWPSEAFSYGRLYPDHQYPADPAAGSGLTLTVPGGQLWRMMAVRAVLTASATVASRVPKLSINDADGNEIIRMATNNTVTANGAALAQWVRGEFNAYTGGDGSLVAFLPQMFLESGWQVVLTATSIQAGDKFTSARFWYEICQDGDFGYPTGPHAADATTIR